MWDLNSPTRDQIQIPCVGNQILSHWTTREVPHTTLNGRTRIKLTWFPSLSSFSLCQLHPQGWELSKGKELWDYKLPAWVKWSEVKLLSCVRLFATPWTLAYQVPSSMGFSRQEYWSGLLFPSPGDLPDPGIKPGSPALQTDALLSEPQGKSSF